MALPLSVTATVAWCCIIGTRVIGIGLVERELLALCLCALGLRERRERERERERERRYMAGIMTGAVG